jgi:hypothetical protein
VLAPEEVAKFPLWTRKQGFGAITIFVGDNDISYISHDQVPAGVQANFKNKPDLELVEYYEKPPDDVGHS